MASFLEALVRSAVRAASEARALMPRNETKTIVLSTAIMTIVTSNSTIVKPLF